MTSVTSSPPILVFARRSFDKRMYEIRYCNTLLDCVSNRWRGLLDICSRRHTSHFICSGKEVKHAAILEDKNKLKEIRICNLQAQGGGKGFSKGYHDDLAGHRRLKR